MKKFKLNYIFFSFIPILVLIPIIYQLLGNIHIGGKDLFLDFIISAFNPNVSNDIIYISLIRINETFFISLFSWTISLIFGTLFGVISSDIFYEFIDLPNFVKRSINTFLNITRSFHELVWCLLLMQIFGISKSIGIFSICIPFSAINAKVIKEQLALISPKTIESITNISGKNISSLITIIWSQINKTIMNFGLYRFECCLRSTAILGLFGIGGIGTNIFLSYQSLNFREMWTYLWSLALLTIISRPLINRFKIKNIKPRLVTLFFSICVLIIFFSIYFLLNISINLLNYDYSIFRNSLSYEEIILPSIYFKAILETIFLCVLSSGIAISLPPLLLLILQNKYLLFFLRVIAFWFRIIPPPIIILILLMFNQPSLALASLVLGLNNAAITFKLLNENLKQSNNSKYIAIKSVGSSNRVSWLIGLFSEQAKSYLSYCAYRSDILIRETAIVGVLGSIGLGWQLNESLSSFAWNNVIVILFAYSSIAILGEIINAKIKAKLNQI